MFQVVVARNVSTSWILLTPFSLQGCRHFSTNPNFLNRVSVNFELSQGLLEMKYLSVFVLSKLGCLTFGSASAFSQHAKTQRYNTVAGLICVEPQDSRVTLHSGSSEYILSIPANKTTFDVVGPDSKLGCIGPVGNKYAICQACNFPVSSLDLSAEAGICAFNLSGLNHIVYHQYDSGPLSLTVPTQILNVQCGLEHVPLAETMPVEPTDILASTHSEPVACPAWTDKTVIKMHEGGPKQENITNVLFEMEIRPDGTRFQVGQLPYSVGCLRRDKLYTDQCFPCTMPFIDIQIGDVDCIFEFYLHGDHNVVSHDFISGPRLTVYGGTGGSNLSAVTCHRKPKPTTRSNLDKRNQRKEILDLKAPQELNDRSTNLGCLGSMDGIVLWDAQGNRSYISLLGDMQYWSLSGSSPSVGCYFWDDHSAYPCYPCYNYEWTSVLASHGLDECRLRIEGQDELYVIPAGKAEATLFNPPIRLLGVQCGFGIRNNPPGIEVRSVPPPQGNWTGSMQQLSNDKCFPQGQRHITQMLQIWGQTLDGYSALEMILRVDKKWQVLSGGTPDVGCYAVPNTSGCLRCDGLVVDRFQVEIPVKGTCQLKLDGLADLVTIDTASSFSVIWQLTVPRRILGINCTVDETRNDTDVPLASRIARPMVSYIQTEDVPPNANDRSPFSTAGSDCVSDKCPREVRHDSTSISDTETTRGIARPIRDIGPGSTDVRCQGPNYKTAIQTQDGQVYYVPVPLDYEFHAMAEMFCIREADAACIPCNQIGSATSVRTEIQWGPCIFFTEDHRAAFTQYWNPLPDGSRMTPPISIDPGNPISGIECGTGA